MENSFTQTEILEYFRTKIMLTTEIASCYLNMSINSFKKIKIRGYAPENKVSYYDINDLDNYLKSFKKMSKSEIDQHAFEFIHNNFKVY